MIVTQPTTRDTARAYLAAWAAGDLDAVRRLLAPDVTVESNLTPTGGPTDRRTWGRTAGAAGLVDFLGRIAPALAHVTLVSETYDAGRAALMYDCHTREPAGTIRTAEFLEIGEAGIHGVRRMYDLVAVGRLLPRLLDR